MTKKEYMQPTTNVVRIQHKCQILAGSLDANGMNTKVQSEEVETGWSRGGSGWDDEE